MRRALLSVTALLAVFIAVAAGLPVSAADDQDLSTRTFLIKYRDVNDIVALIQPAVSDRGSYAVRPRIKTVTVTDTDDSLARIQELIEGFDLPPRGVGLVIQLMLAEEGSPSEQAGKPARRQRGVPPSVIQDVTKWGLIKQIGSASVTTAENETGSVAMGPDHRVKFAVGAVSANIGIIRMERFVLERLDKPSDGDQVYVPVMDLVLNLRDGQVTVLGATSSQDSKQAIFVSVTAALKEK